MTSSAPIAVVLVTHNSAAELPSTLSALSAQLGANDEIAIVDNASADGTADLARRLLPSARVIETGGNLGFAAGCHIGARATRAPLLFFLNPDCIAGPGCLEALREVADARPDWDAWQALVTLPGGREVNTAGNVVHVLGIGWAGRLGHPVDEVPPEPTEVGFCSGAALVVRRTAWERTGGFDERYFMYCEDLDLSLRLRLAGSGVGIAPAARVEHAYTFAKGDYKWYYLERNRTWTVLGTYPSALLTALAPALLAFELALLVVAWRGGWLGAKLRAHRAVMRELPQIVRRRKAIQATRAVSARSFAEALTTSLNSPHLASAREVPGLPRLVDAYWRLVVAVLP